MPLKYLGSFLARSVNSNSEKTNESKNISNAKKNSADKLVHNS